MDVGLARRRNLPPGGREDWWTAPDGWRIRTVRWPGARGTLIAATGRGDFIEKYAEAWWWWLERGWSLLAFDWRGQGGSGRVGASALHGHSPGFARWTQDLAGLIGWAAATGPAPLVGVGHSMGGHLWLRLLAGGEARVGRVALSAPMLGITAGGVPRGLAQSAAGAARALSLSQRFLPGQALDLSPAMVTRRAAALTGDAARAQDEGWWLAARPELRLGGPTWGWLGDAWASIRLLEAPGVLERVATPVRMVLAGEEAVTDNAAAMRAVARLRGSDYRVIPGGRHELWRDADGPRTAAMAASDEWLEAD